MSALRGDDDIMSLMDIMATNQGYEKKERNNSSGSKQEDKLKTSEGRVRLISEIPGYKQGGDSRSKFAQKNEEEEEIIWNPYVHVPINSSSTNVVFAPTNPDVEVYRRRSYEKFKKKFYILFNFIVGNASKNFEKKKSDNKQNDEKVSDKSNAIWTKLSAHAILERFHFACKLEENVNVIQNVLQQDCSRHEDTPCSIRDILSIMLKGKSNGTIIDPILLSSHKHEVHASKSKTKVQTIPASQLLRNEIEFQCRREWKRSKGKMLKNRDVDDVELEDFFSSLTFKRTVNKIIKDTNDLAAEIQHEFMSGLQKKVAMLTSSSHGKRGKRNRSIPKISTHVFENPPIDSSTSTATSVEHAGLSFRINESFLTKLQLLFDRNNKNSSSLSLHQATFNSALFSLLARYDMLEGAGLQSALNENVFDILLEKFDCKTECFASPFNSRYERYFSAFPDTDIPFGSLGSFFDFDFKTLEEGACFQANPPFAADFILRMYKRMENVLGDESISVSLMFIVFIPAWNETDGWNALNTSPFLTQHILLSQKEDPHYYCEGTQHRRTKSRYRVASFDTSIFFLQNQFAARKWHVTSQTIEELKVAFGSNPDENKKESSKEIKYRIESNQSDKSITKQFHEDTNNDYSTKKKRKKTQEKKTIKPKRRKSKTFKKQIDEREGQMQMLASMGILTEKGGKDAKKDKKSNSSKT